MILLVALLLIAGAVAGCGGPAHPEVPPPAAGSASPPAGTFRHAVTVDGQSRSYRIHVPPTQGGAALPMVIALHGGGGNGEGVERQSRLSELADEEGFLVAYPDGSGRHRRTLLTWNAWSCCGYARDHGVDDVGFIAALLDDVAERYPVDETRVYATGLSNGAMMAYRLGCELSSRIAAIAAVAGALNTDECTPGRPVPVVVFHGTADRNVLYEGGPSPGAGFGREDGRVDRPVSYAVSFWAGHNGCPALPAVSRDGTVVRTTHAPCSLGSEVVLYTIEGGGHAWPGGTGTRRGGDTPPPAPDASAVLWEFFSRHNLAGRT